MNRIIVAIAVAFAVPSVVLACGTGCVEMGGVCACEAKAETVASVPTPTSNEKPSRHPEPAYQRGNIHADMPMPESAESELKKMQEAAHDSKAEAEQK